MLAAAIGVRAHTVSLALYRSASRVQRSTARRAVTTRAASNTVATSEKKMTTKKLPKARPLGSAKGPDGQPLMVTEVCLGTMTFGVQNTEEDAHAQLDYAVKERGVNFIDTAEMYPVPSSAAGWKPGTTEEYIGTWIEKNPTLRSEIILATKIAGFNPGSETGGNRFVPPKPSADCRLDRESVLMACDASLRRLRTDYIDLYQLHWPDRYAPNFGQSVYDPTKERDAVPIKETVAALGELIAAGKIRHYGLSNETTYGVCEFVRAADELGVPRPVSIQNSFCLLHRTFETELAEACAPSHYDIGLLPWTPLAGGALTGKYLHGKKPAEGRLVKFPAFMQRYLSARGGASVGIMHGSLLAKCTSSTFLSVSSLSVTRSASNASMFSLSCSIVVAPMMVEVQYHRVRHHASESVARDTPASFAMASYASVASTHGAFRYLCMNAGNFTSRPSAGAFPCRYFPDRAPPASGVHGRSPMS